MSRKQIRRLVEYVRKLAKIEDEVFFPILQFVENVLPVIFDDFQFEVVPMEEMGNKHGESFPNRNIIRIREDVYMRAVRGEGRDRLTIAHEVGHFFMHEADSISLCQLARGEKLRAFEDPEWQADAFGGELLAPAHLIRGMSIREVQRKCPSGKFRGNVVYLKKLLVINSSTVMNEKVIVLNRQMNNELNA